ncbi:MAG: hypothetical protein ACREPG_08700 [Candidatus Binatia bacterium]
MFALAIGMVGWNTYWSWKAGPWDLPSPGKSGGKNLVAENQAPPSIRPLVNPDVIVSKNLFDPERGAGATREAEENSRSFQRVRGMVLIGTVIIGNNRVAILQEGTVSPGAGQRPGGQSASLMRLKVGDNVDGFRLTEIADKRVVFAKDASRVEVLLDYFRKVDAPAPPRPTVPSQVTAPTPGVPVPRVVPNLPRRGQIPVPANPNPES